MKKNPEGWRKGNYKNYGITLETYNQMHKKQDGKCYICGGTNRDGKRLGVDHNHITGKVRKLLCRRCNIVLGAVGDSVVLLKKAMDYLKNEELELR
jgi:hypothetical protein